MTASDVLIVLPTLGDRLDLLRQTLESAADQQRDVPARVVMVVPVHAREARALASDYDATVVDDPGLGLSEAINRGIASRTTERFYAWIGDDDLFRPGGLRHLRNMMLASSGSSRPVVAYGGCEYIAPDGTVIALSAAGPLAPLMLSWGPDLIPHPGALIDLDAIERVGGFDPDLEYAMDLDLFLKLRRVGRFVWSRRPVSAFRWHPDSLTVSGRLASSLESEAIKRRHLPPVIAWASPLWARPLRWASARAAAQLNARASAAAGGARAS